MEKPRFYFRLSTIDLAELKKRALLAKQTPSEFARLALFPASVQGSILGRGRVFDDTSKVQMAEEGLNRLEALEQSVGDFQLSLRASLDLISKLCMASIASSALLSDDGKSTNEVARKQILDHIEEAMKISPGLLKIHVN